MSSLSRMERWSIWRLNIWISVASLILLGSINLHLVQIQFTLVFHYRILFNTTCQFGHHLGQYASCDFHWFAEVGCSVPRVVKKVLKNVLKKLLKLKSTQKTLYELLKKVNLLKKKTQKSASNPKSKILKVQLNKK